MRHLIGWGLAAALAAAPAGPAAAAAAGDTRIIGGTEVADEAAYPWMTRVALTVPRGTALCGGMLVSPDIVLTAAHCFTESAPNDKPSKIVLDIGRRDPATAEAAGQRRTGVDYRHGAGVGKSDWAVIKLDQPLAAPALPRLADTGALDTAPRFRALGWGMTVYGGPQAKLLRQVDLALVPDGDRRCSSDPQGEKPEMHICAGDGKTTTCMGDSGGPLIAPPAGHAPGDTPPDRWTLVGITSWGYACGSRDNSPGRYAQVSVFARDIRAAVTAVGGQQPAG